MSDIRKKYPILLFFLFFLITGQSFGADSPLLFTFFDPLNDLSKCLSHSANAKIESSNESNFNDDKGRLVRTNIENAHLVYFKKNIKGFYIDVWNVDSTGGEIYVSVSADGVTYENIQLLRSLPKSFGYRSIKRIRPTEVLQDSINYLKIEVLGGVVGTAWKTQIGSIAIDYHREPRNPKLFYIDSETGSDSNSGESPALAWKSLAKINQTLFFPGDSIMLKSGGIFNGMLKPQGNGKPELPIVITTYGGTDLPVIDGKNQKACIHLLNAENWIISNLELTNNAGHNPSEGALIYRSGILVETNTTGIKRNIQLKNLKIHHIYPAESTTNEVGPGVYKGYGIHFLSDGRIEKTFFDDILVDSCAISFTSYYGIWTQHTGYDPNDPEWNYNKNFTIRNCNIIKTGSAGMVMQYMNNLLVEYNTVSNPGTSEEPKQYGRGSGIWTWRSKNVVIQHNRFMHARGFTDSCGAHIDFGNRNVTIQYNFSYDNAGGFVEILGDCKNSVYRYNISINDGFRIAGKDGAWQDGKIIWIAAYNGKNAPLVGSTQSKIYNNTIYVGEGIKTNILFEKLTENNFVKNNIFYIEGDVTFAGFGVNNRFNHNIYYGNVPKLPFGDMAIFGDPQLQNPGGTAPMDYHIKQNSIAVNTGDTITEADFHDFWGDSLNVSLPIDRGADETAIQSAFTNINAMVTSTGGNIFPSGNVPVPANSNFPFKIIPKPAKDELIIKGLVNSREVIVLDARGKVMIHDFLKNKLDISCLTPGIYFIRFKNTNRVLKFVKSND